MLRCLVRLFQSFVLLNGNLLEVGRHVYQQNVGFATGITNDIRSLPEGEYAFFEGNNSFINYPQALADDGYNYGIIHVSANETNNGWKSFVIHANDAAASRIKVYMGYCPQPNGNLLWMDVASKSDLESKAILTDPPNTEVPDLNTFTTLNKRVGINIATLNKPDGASSFGTAINIGYAANVFTQILIDNDGTRLYYRQYISWAPTVWSNWKIVATAADLDSRYKIGGDITSGTVLDYVNNLKTISSMGEFYQKTDYYTPSDNAITTWGKYRYEKLGSMQWMVYFVQEYSRNIYVRLIVGDAWNNEWIKLTNSADLQSMDNRLNGSIEAKDCNVALTYGIYTVNISTINAPGNIYGILIVETGGSVGSSDGQWTYQQIKTTNGDIYSRRKINSEPWTEWEKQTK